MPTESNATKTSSTAQTGTAKKESSSMNDTAPLQKFFIDALKDMLWAENAIIGGLQKLQKAATSEELKDAFEDHELLTKKHISRLEKVFSMLGEKPEPKKCKAMEGILKEADEIIEETPEGTATRDATLIIAAQKVEHYEIASYGGLVAIAHTLGHDKAADLLQKTLNEEEETDYNLTDIAESQINFEAMEEDASVAE
ncbi:hypothetical protein D3C71_74340 [compost metagenome]